MAKWNVRKVNSALTVVDANGNRIAQVSSGKGLPTQQEEENANKIAAFPEVLAALKQIIECDPGEEDLDAAVSAIAKAEGKPCASPR